VQYIHRFLIALGHGNDLVPRAQTAIALSRSAGDQTLHPGRPFVVTEQGSDAFQGELHADGEILLAGGRHVIGVGIVGAGEAVQVPLQQPARVVVLHDGQEAVVAFANLLLGRQLGLGGAGRVGGGVALAFVHRAFLLPDRLGHLAGHQLMLDLAPPQIVPRLLVLRPRRVLALPGVGFVLAQVKALVEQFLDVSHAIGHPGLEHVVNFVGDGHVARLQLVIQVLLDGLEVRDVGGQEIGALAVQGAQENFQRVGGDMVVQGFPAQMTQWHVEGQHAGHPALMGVRRHVQRERSHGGGGQQSHNDECIALHRLFPYHHVIQTAGPAFCSDWGKGLRAKARSSTGRPCTRCSWMIRSRASGVQERYHIPSG